MRPDICEWKPSNDTPAIVGDDTACANEATVSLRYAGLLHLHLCASCAARPIFSRVRKRTPIGRAALAAEEERG